MVELLRLEKIRKTFPGIIANKEIDLAIQKGEVHALLGENGAGKSTLMNVVYGVYRPDGGKIFWKGTEVEIHNAREAIALGIGMVHQQFRLVPTLTVAENIVLGLPSNHEPFLDMSGLEARIQASAQRYHLSIDPGAKIWQLPVGVQQRVEILKALYRNAELLILDEPTAVLTPGEVADLFHVLKALTADGLSIIFITHKLNEVMEICDRVTVLRDGAVVDTVAKNETTISDLARLMVGREVLNKIEKPDLPAGEVVLSVSGLRARNDRGLSALNGISFEIHRSEILGVAGVDGNGQFELAEAIARLRKLDSGKIELLGRDVSRCTPRDMMDQKVSYIPPDRYQTGLLMDFSIIENLIGKSFFRFPFSRRGIFQQNEIKKFAQRSIERFDIRTPDSRLAVKLLSGGNQQKVILAREISSLPDLLIASQPTRGLDIGAAEYVHQQMIAARNQGAAVLLISTELDEILLLSDRIAVMYEGEIMGIIPAGTANIQEIGEMMAGVRRMDEIVFTNMDGSQGME